MLQCLPDIKAGKRALFIDIEQQGRIAQAQLREHIVFLVALIDPGGKGRPTTMSRVPSRSACPLLVRHNTMIDKLVKIHIKTAPVLLVFNKMNFLIS